MEIKKLNDVFTDWTTVGIFKTLYDVATAASMTLPWSASASDIDMEYHGNHSGDKITAPLVDKFIAAGSTGKLTTANLQVLARIILNNYLDNWQKRWDAYFEEEYEPLENYDRNETKTGGDISTQRPTNWKTTETQTPNGWKTTTQGSASDNAQNASGGVYGFNSAAAVPSDTSSSSESHKSESTQAGTYTTETVQSGTLATEIAYNNTVKVHGNIGVTTSQEMLESELALRGYNYFEKVFNDVDSVLTISIY